MSALVSHDYLNCALKSLPATPQDSSSWLKQLRAQAIDRVGQQRLPTIQDEEWRFTDISPLANLPFKPAQATCTVNSSDIQPYCIAEATQRLVFVDGFFSAELSNLSDHRDLIIGNLASMMKHHAANIEPHLGQQVPVQNNIFAALNMAFLQDGAIIVVPKNAMISTPVHLLFIATQQETTNYPRCLIVGEENSQVTVIEDYITLQNGAYITNSVAEFALAPNAQARHIRVQRENSNAFHLANCAVSLDHASCYQSTSVTLGAQISRYNLDIAFKAEAGECTADGLAMIRNTQLADTHTRIDHLKPNCTSHQQQKCIVDDAAHAVFNGKIIVHPNAQQTNSTQSSRNLLLSSQAQMDTKPQLEIFADDVKCAHGATVGQLDNEEIFYLKSRGLPEKAARNLLTYAFGAEILDRIPVTSIKNTLEQTVLHQTQNS